MPSRRRSVRFRGLHGGLPWGVHLEYNGSMVTASRTRLQLELQPRHQRLLHMLGEQMGSAGDADTTRRILDVVENLMDRIRQGYKLAAVPIDDEHPDAIPELTRALRPELHLSLIHISEPTRQAEISYAVFCLKKKKKQKRKKS